MQYTCNDRPQFATTGFVPVIDIIIASQNHANQEWLPLAMPSVIHSSSNLSSAVTRFMSPV
jgi:hypothetical protein